MSYVLAIDQGTSSTRAIIYSPEGALVTSSQRPHKQYYPKPGWVEHDPEEIWRNTLEVMQTVIKRVDVKQILACGISNQRETTLIWDKQTGRCLAPAIVWQDRRTEDFCEGLAEKAEFIQKKTGLLPDPYFSASKLRWFLQNIPEAKELAAQNRLSFGTIDSFLLWRLTGGKAHCTDPTNASRTLLFNIFEQTWDEELLDLFEIPASVLPEVKDSDSQFGIIEQLGIPIRGIVGDQQAALIGQRAFKKGMVKATFGTGGFLLLNTGLDAVLSKHKLLTTIAYRIKGQTHYGLEGAIFQAGSMVKWLRDELKLIENASDTEVLAKSLVSSEGVYLVPAFTGLGAPHWISKSGAIFTGLTLGSNRAHFARAVLESVCYQTREVLDCMQEDSNTNLERLRVDGGMSANSWFLQCLASQCALAVERPLDIETTAQGAAMLAALSSGLVDSLEDLEKSWHCETVFQPEKNEALDVDFFNWKKAVKLLQM